MMILLREQKRSGRKVCSGHDNKEADVTEISYIRSICHSATSLVVVVFVSIEIGGEKDSGLQYSPLPLVVWLL